MKRQKPHSTWNPKKYHLDEFTVPIYIATLHGRLDVLRQLKKDNVDIHYINPNGDSMLHIAAVCGFPAIIAQFIEWGIPVDLVCNEMTPAAKAVMSGQLKSLRTLHQYGANLYTFTNIGTSLLTEAAASGFTKIMVQLLKWGFPIDSRDREGHTAIQKAVIHLRNYDFEILQKHGASLDVLDKNGESLLMMAIHNSDLNSKLLSLNVDTNIVAHNGMSAMSKAAGFDDVGLMEQLRGLNTSYHTVGKCSPIHCAAKYGSLDALKKLIKWGVPVDMKNDMLLTPLYIAVTHGYLDVVTYLHDVGADIFAIAPDGTSPFHIAASEGHDYILSAMLDWGVPIDSMTPTDMTALHYAASNGRESAIKLLISRGADVTRCTSYGVTPFMLAVAKGFHSLLKFLDTSPPTIINATAPGGITAMHLATEYGHVEVMKTLYQMGARLDVCTDDGWTPLLIASFSGLSTPVLQLLFWGVPVEDKLPDGSTSVYLAAQQGHLAVIKLLRSKGATLECVRADGMSPLSISTLLMHQGVLTYLIECGVSAI